MDAKSARDRLVAELAAEQYGVVSLAQLGAAGLGRGAVAHRVRAGRLHPVHRGVYAVGHRRLPREGWWLAAVLACGPGARLSHLAAGSHWDLRPSAANIVDVTLPSRAGRRRRDGIRIHRPRAFHATDGLVHDGIPITSVALTLIDLGELIGPAAHARTVERAELLGLFDLAAVHDALARHPARPGSRRLSSVLDAYRDDVLTRSELEAMFLALCARYGIPAPAVNARVEGLEVDFFWRARRLIAETDGLRHHGTRAAFERDRVRDAQLMVAGFRVVRFTYRQVRDEPALVARTLHRLLAAPAHMLAG